MVHIHRSSTAHAPLEVAFAYVDDYRTVPEWLFGVQKFEPVGDLDRGLGAVFDGSMKLGPTTLHSTIEVTRWKADELIAFESIKGFVNRSTWHFASAGPEATELTVDFEYELPGGLAGKALGRAIEPFVAIAVRHTEHTLREKVEELHNSGR
jgi:uncharacterized membrane protein